MLRQSVDIITKLVTWIYRNRIIKPQGAVVKVNLGSGLSVDEGREEWINVDASV